MGYEIQSDWQSTRMTKLPGYAWSIACYLYPDLINLLALNIFGWFVASILYFPRLELTVASFERQLILDGDSNSLVYKRWGAEIESSVWFCFCTPSLIYHS